MSGKNRNVCNKRQKWLKNFLLLTDVIPQLQIYERVISLLDTNKVNKICIEFSDILIEIDKNKK